MPDRSRLLRPSRRQFLAAAAATTLLGACGGDSDVSSEDGGSSSSTTGGGDELSVVRFYGPYFIAGGANRVPFALADVDGILPTDASPDEVGVTVRRPDGSEVGGQVTAKLRSEGIPRGYYAFEFIAEEPGFFDFTVDTGSAEVVSQLQVTPADDPIVSQMVGRGDPMPAIETPTVADPKGVTPICTREPPCDLHARTVAEVVGTAPMVLMVSTPAFCQTAICGPVLDVLLDRMGAFPGVTFVHAEVYADPANNEQPPVPDDFAPVIEQLHLAFEPVMYTVGADGVVLERLDYIFDGSEITETIERLVV